MYLPSAMFFQSFKHATVNAELKQVPKAIVFFFKTFFLFELFCVPSENKLKTKVFICTHSINIFFFFFFGIMLAVEKVYKNEPRWNNRFSLLRRTKTNQLNTCHVPMPSTYTDISYTNNSRHRSLFVHPGPEWIPN